MPIKRTQANIISAAHIAVHTSPLLISLRAFVSSRETRMRDPVDEYLRCDWFTVKSGSDSAERRRAAALALSVAIFFLRCKYARLRILNNCRTFRIRKMLSRYWIAPELVFPVASFGSLFL